MDLNRHQEAISTLEHAVQLDPENALAFYNWELFYSRTKQNKNAIKAFKKSLALNPDFGEARLYLAAVYLATNDRNSAFEQYSQLKILNLGLAEKLYQALFRNTKIVNVK